MKGNDKTKHYITNMDKSDPILHDYILNAQKEVEVLHQYKENNENIKLNFSVTYGNGEQENFSCGDESPIFGGKTKNEYKHSSKVMHEDVKKNKFHENVKVDRSVNGIIKVVASLKGIGGEPLTGVKINLYVTNGVSPRLVRSAISDINGVVIFTNLECGNYRVIEIIDKKFFEKPIYKKWNEVNISDSNEYEEVFIINNIRGVQ
ncbi:MAG: prealbumin-like fold domain-containing protein [Clostridium sp.]